MEGVEIVIKPIHLERAIYAVIIIVLAVLLITHWGKGSCDADKEKAAEETPTATGLNETNQTINATSQQDKLCADTVKNQDETDIDCGGTKCPKCAENKFCVANTDCATGLFCFQGIRCKKPTCDDGVKNQNETQIDCGGICGGYWWTADSKCHTSAEPSGKLTINLAANTSTSPLSGAPILYDVTITLDNGLSNTLTLTAEVYALKENGAAAMEDVDGNNIMITSADLESVPPGGKITKKISLVGTNRNTLSEVDGTDKYQIQVDFRNSIGELVKTAYWTNP